MIFQRLKVGLLVFLFPMFVLKFLISELTDQYRYIAENKGVKFVLATDEACKNLVVNTDASRLVQVLNNFLSNAIKHTETGSITLGCRMEKNHLRFWVADTGRGIPREDLPHVFERFYQAGNHHAGGTGLGLAIARSIVEYLGGEIEVESQEGKGSRFGFTHPLDLNPKIL